VRLFAPKKDHPESGDSTAQEKTEETEIEESAIGINELI